VDLGQREAVTDRDQGDLENDLPVRLRRGPDLVADDLPCVCSAFSVWMAEPDRPARGRSMDVVAFGSR
jgi:hypothetical protein